MRVLILHDAVPEGAKADESDVLAQVAAVGDALSTLGHTHRAMPVTLDLGALRDHLQEDRPELVFNLVESLASQGRLIHTVPSLLDSLAIAYTGNTTDAVYTTSNKVLAKRWMVANGLPTPEWFDVRALKNGVTVHPGKYILKSVWEHASIGLDAHSIVDVLSKAELRDALRTREPLLAGEGFAEMFVDGREFNISILTDEHGKPEILPHAEIIFDGYDANRPKVVDYHAKWDPASYEYHHTPRSFTFAAHDRPLLDQLSRLCLLAWRTFDLAGYARIDFRIDEQGRPFVLEVNANPCLSPDAGFAAALGARGLDIPRAVERLVVSALRHKR